ncbi:MAG: 50S ribosomal protein L21 [Gammaproteobacteria bacterium RIFCSPHIGHO2_12_FULL_42_10]|nr:MAG: 50S ribosomal protein L21 [Gammaproteobacteria bacterium RIFCSPHIGHO2_12_FULL_42_10]
MYAVIFSGGKQYRVRIGDVLCLETLDVAVGDTVRFEQVMAIGEGESLNVGRPYVEGSQVAGKVLSHGRHKKVEIIKFRRRKHHMKRQGHRQNYTQVEITSIA